MLFTSLSSFISRHRRCTLSIVITYRAWLIECRALNSSVRTSGVKTLAARKLPLLQLKSLIWINERELGNGWPWVHWFALLLGRAVSHFSFKSGNFFRHKLTVTHLSICRRCGYRRAQILISLKTLSKHALFMIAWKCIWTAANEKELFLSTHFFMVNQWTRNGDFAAMGLALRMHAVAGKRLFPKDHNPLFHSIIMPCATPYGPKCHEPTPYSPWHCL